MAKSNERQLINYRYALAFFKLISSNKKKAELNKRKNILDLGLDDSYGKLSSSTGLRSATISAIVGGQSDPKASTLHLLLNALGKSYTQFGRIMDSLTDEEVNEYKRIKENQRTSN